MEEDEDVEALEPLRESGRTATEGLFLGLISGVFVYSSEGILKVLVSVDGLKCLENHGGSV